ncbi:MAG: hypothetical protein DI598_15815, partial [Pseudopedobacter saltans]
MNVIKNNPIYKNFIEGDSLSKKVTKNIFLSFLIKILSIAINLVLIPITIDYVNPEKYGVWLTISALVTWFNFFDFGLGNGLRNKLAEALSLNDRVNMAKIVSTAYGTISLVSVVLLIVLLILNSFIDWTSILNLSKQYSSEIGSLINAVLVFFTLQFILQLINPIHYAYQKAAKVSGNYLLGSILSLVGILILKRISTGNLLYLGIVYFSGNIIALLISNAIFFLKNKDLLPSLKNMEKKVAKAILNLGGMFFIIQIASLVQFESVNIIISRYFGPIKVTEYNLAYKLFSVVSMVFGILLAPIWSAVTQAAVTHNYEWINKTKRILLYIWVALAIVTTIIYFLSPWLYKVWLHQTVEISRLTSLGVSLYVLAMAFGQIYVSILNGLGTLKTQ